MCLKKQTLSLPQFLRESENVPGLIRWFWLRLSPVIDRPEGILSKVAHLCSFCRRPQFLTTWASSHWLCDCSRDMATNSPKADYRRWERKREGRTVVPFMISHNMWHTIICTLKKILLESSYLVQPRHKSKGMKLHFLKLSQRCGHIFNRHMELQWWTRQTKFALIVIFYFSKMKNQQIKSLNKVISDCLVLWKQCTGVCVVEDLEAQSSQGRLIPGA